MDALLDKYAFSQLCAAMRDKYGTLPAGWATGEQDAVGVGASAGVRGGARLQLIGWRVRPSHLQALASWGALHFDDEDDDSDHKEQDGWMGVSVNGAGGLATEALRALWRAPQRAWSLRTVRSLTLRRAGLGVGAARALAELTVADDTAEAKTAEWRAMIEEQAETMPPPAVHMGSLGATSLLPRAVPWSSLLSLSLAHNNIGDNGISALSSALLPPAAPHLTQLDLSFNVINDFGAAALAAVLRRRGLAQLGEQDQRGVDRLQSLNLSYNIVGVSGVRAIVSQLTLPLRS